jgi:FtsH-binding integral membrane protein
MNSKTSGFKQGYSNMALQDRDYMRTGSSVATDGYDAGLRAHMLRVYNYMCAGLILTGLVAFGIANSQAAVELIFFTPLKWVAMLAPLAFILVLSFGVHKMTFSTLQMVFWAFAAAMGVSMASIFLVYTGGSIAKVFFITAGMFAATSLYGYTTKRDLAKMGSFLFMGLIGLLIAMVVNIFTQSSAMQFAISVLGVLIFTGLTAWDTQRIKEQYYEGHGYEVAGKMAIMGAVTLYLDFVNMFQFLLALLGNRE